MSARQHRPDDVLAVDVHAARREALHGRLRVVPRHLVDLGQRGLRRVRSGDEAPKRARHALDGSPDRAVVRRRVAVELHVRAACPSLDPPADSAPCTRRACRCRCCRATNALQPCAAFSSCVLSQIFVSNQPSTPGGPERRPQHVVVVEVHVAPREAGIDGRRSASSSGSYMISPRCSDLIGNNFADG